MNAQNIERLEGIVIEVYQCRILCNGKVMYKFNAESMDDMLQVARAKVNTFESQGVTGDWGLEYK